MVDRLVKYTTVSSCLKEQLKFLNTKGYKVINDNVEVIYPKIELLNIVFASNNRKISFSYSEKNVNGEIIDNFNIMISKDKYNFFSFDTYLKSIGIKSPKEMLTLSSYDGNFEEKMESFCVFLKDIFFCKLSKIISGDEWINIGIEWDSYK